VFIMSAASQGHRLYYLTNSAETSADVGAAFPSPGAAHRPGAHLCDHYGLASYTEVTFPCVVDGGMDAKVAARTGPLPAFTLCSLPLPGDLLAGRRCAGSAHEYCSRSRKPTCMTVDLRVVGVYGWIGEAQALIATLLLLHFCYRARVQLLRPTPQPNGRALGSSARPYLWKRRRRQRSDPLNARPLNPSHATGLRTVSTDWPCGIFWRPSVVQGWDQ
jgi:hypothetical protein